MSLELDPRIDLPIPQQPEKEPYPHHNEEQMDNGTYPIGPYTSHTSAQQHGPKTSTVFLLGAALAIMTVLAVVAAAVGGSIAARRRHEINRLETLLGDRCAANITAISGDEDVASSTPLSLAPATTSDSASTSTPTFTLYDPQKDTIVPSSNCSAMGSIYTSANSQAPFTIHCKTNYPGSDMLSVWVFTFADCMEACAKYNAHPQNTQRCYAITFNHNQSLSEQSGFGNCWIKDSDTIAAQSDNMADSGVFNFDS